MTPPTLTTRAIAAVATGAIALTSLTALTLAGAATAPASAAPADWTSQNTEFVTRDGATLRLGGEPFRFNGANAYWLGLDENVGGVDYPTFFRIKDAIDTADEMGLTVLRSHMMTSTGQNDANPLAIMPSLGEYNEEAFATIDFAIAYAGERGIRLILPLTDEWEYYHGGHRDFTTPLGLQSADFYTDRAAIGAYQEYVDRIVGRTNTLTGVPYAADPTILAWELGNELEGMTLPWIDEQVAFIRERAPEQLVSAGRRFDIDPDTLASADLDIVDVHYYPPTAQKVTADAAAVVAAGKVYVAGEYGSNSASPALLDPLVANDDVSGMMLWSLFGHNDRGGFVPHDDGFTLHYPGTTAKMREQVVAITGFSRALRSETGTLALGQPLITSVDNVNGVNEIAWRGTAGAATYRVEVSTDGITWTSLGAGAVPAEASPATDLASTPGSRYRVVPVKLDGSVGPASETAQPGADADLLVDPLQSFSLASAHPGVVLEGTPRGAIARAGGSGGSITWAGERINRVQVRSAAGAAPAGSISIEVRRGDAGWQRVEGASVGDVVDTGVFEDASAVRVALMPGVALASVTLSSAAAVPTSAPGAFALSAPADGAEGVRATPRFVWTEAPDAAYYRFTLRAEGAEEPLVALTGLRGTTLDPAVELAPGTTYVWTVVAVNGTGETVSDPRSATFEAAPLPETDRVIEDFESYADAASVNAAYVRNTGGGAIAGALAEAPEGDGSSPDGQTADFAYDLAGPGYAGVTHKLAAPDDWWGYDSIAFTARGGSPDQDLSVQFVAGGAFWEATVAMPGADWTEIEIPFDDFAPPSWAGEGVLDPTQVTEFSFYLGGSGAGTLSVDDVRLVAPAAVVPPVTEPTPSPSPTLPPSTESPVLIDPDAAGAEGAAPNAGKGLDARLANSGADGGVLGVLALALLGAGLVIAASRRRRGRTG
ncbi:CIA30 family protein [Okibacterium fritillariae]|uniref:CIA30 family protein n=1 Tax=Okibacterium fritillariae TaxID=123320 RepID=UPI00405563BB